MSNEKQNKMDALLGRALRDKEFRQKLLDNPAEAASEAELSPAELELVSGGLALTSFIRPINPIAYCTEKTCNEGGGIVLRPVLPVLPVLTGFPVLR